MTQPLTMTLNPAIDKTITLPTFELGGLNRLTHKPVIDPGGKGVNVAKVLNQLNTPVTATGYIAGQSGQKFVEELTSLGINTAFQNIQGDIRTNLKIVDQSREQTTEINEPGFSVEDKDILKFNQTFDELLNDTSYLVLGGSTPKGIGDDQYRRYIELAKQKGVKTILDASGSALREGLKANPYAIKPNIHELEELYDTSFETKDDVLKASHQLVEGGVQLVIVSLGADGALFVGREESYEVNPFKIVPKSTVGAGDSMVGAIVYALNHNFSLKQLSKWSTTAGTITASKAGTNVCTLAEIEELVDQVHVQAIK
ncbi:1-phosphofructokinase [Alkalibacillus haloalkaliphilus]|uniref:Tagatose-6-phosphate kinase n=1 Tax=Alkalibacillus haloalkaliphilus TaxID=94136 RepID=A0A511W5Q0_9BACI|nr:1-phosphofructokinase [Alkalibacillus haloalkaliphilus]GEN46297.1 tagatose-6-phosphate kinase [Alkalibacillus haloalkaliphilus]